LRTAQVRHARDLTPRLREVVLEGLPGIRVDEPAASIRLLLPEPEGLVVPAWDGNEFLLPDGRRPGLRTLTPFAADPDAGEVSVAVVLHGRSRLVDWARTVAPGAPVAVSGPGRGHRLDPDAAAHVLLGDESALPAIRQLVDAAPSGPALRVVVEVADATARVELAPAPVAAWPVATGRPGDALVTWLADAPLGAGEHVWAAGEAAAMQRIRRHLLDVRGLPRAQCTVRGYWKLGRPGT
jgi:NADPH-dependent ferric siderophore reductase